MLWMIAGHNVREIKYLADCRSITCRWEVPVDIDGARLSVQAFVGSAGGDGVLYVAMGTIATLGEALACRLLHPPCLAGSGTSRAMSAQATSLGDEDNLRAPSFLPSGLRHDGVLCAALARQAGRADLKECQASAIPCSADCNSCHSTCN